MAGIEDFKGRWALVTGASAGIGAAMARELAGHGAKLILTARRRERLDALAAELSAQGVETLIVIADLNDPAAPQQIYDATEGAGIEVDIVLNNAGLGNYGVFSKSDIEKELGQVRVNCDAVTRVARLFLPRMVERRRGWMLIVSSIAAFVPLPFSTTYAATKAFDRSLALGLAAEVRRFGVKVSTLCPGSTESEFFDIANAAPLRRGGTQPVDQVARKAVAGLAKGKGTIFPNFSSDFIAFIMRFLPAGTIASLIERVLRSATKTAAE